MCVQTPEQEKQQSEQETGIEVEEANNNED
jgi:hypothetical protein